VRHNATYRLGDGIRTLAEQLRSAGFATAAVVGAFVLDGRFGLDRGFDVYDDRMEGRRSGQVGFAERPADQVVDAALAWLEGAPQRFFLWVHFYDPHAGYGPPPGFASAFASRPYAGEIAFVDAQLGRLLEEIERRWPDGRTLVALTSDHGESLGEHGEETHSYSIYDATQRVPLVLRGPGLPSGRVVPSLVRLVDVAPTLLAAAGAAPLPGAEGRDLRPLIDGRDPADRVAYLETLATRLDYGWSPLFGVRDSRFKYIRAPRPELYDLQSDPSELHNLAETMPEATARLDRLLAQRLAAQAGPLTGGDVALGEADRQRLRKLGYVVADANDPRPVSIEVSGPDPKDEIALLSVMADAEREVAAGQLDTALERLASVESAGVAVAVLRASIAVAVQRYRLAERDARLVIARQPGRSDAWVILGRALAGQGRLAPARIALERGLELDPGNAAALTLLGLVHETTSNPRAAEASDGRAQQVDSRASEATKPILERPGKASPDDSLPALAPVPDELTAPSPR
jgi:tetratricopeptide (TPR) repeat protein